jgi:hypothetical protein
MAAQSEHLAKLQEGVESWNQWRNQNPEIRPELSRADLRAANLTGADLRNAYLNNADLRGANLDDADFRNACLRDANLSGTQLGGAIFSFADLSGANLTETSHSTADFSASTLKDANLKKANLPGSDFSDANLSGADLTGADLRRANLVGANLEGANLTACFVYGISAWNVRLKGAIQSNLVITPELEPAIQLDNLDVAQFIYLLLNNNKIRHLIDTITSKVVLILGRFTPERKIVLDAIRDELRKRDYAPILFDFEKPASKDLTGTITTLANMARFIIADLTDPGSIPYELAMIVQGVAVPVQPILLERQREFAMFVDLKNRYRWVMAPYQYSSEELLIAHLGDCVIAPAESKADEMVRALRNVSNAAH